MIMRYFVSVSVMSLILMSCAFNTDEGSYSRVYEHLESVYFLDGSLQFERHWNDTLDGGFIDEDILWLSEVGDTIMRRSVVFSLGVHTSFNNDSVDYRFFRIWDPNFFIEKLLFIENKGIVPDESIFMYISDLDDSLKFSYIGMDMQSFEIQLFETSKVELEEPDFVFVAKDAEPLFIPKTTLSDHQIIRVEYLRKKVFESDFGEVRQGFTTLFSLYEKLELQNIIEMDKICEPYLSD